jgi:hypothetical protein
MEALLKITRFEDFVHHTEFLTQRFGNWIWFRLQVRGGWHVLCPLVREGIPYRDFAGEGQQQQ